MLEFACLRRLPQTIQLSTCLRGGFQRFLFIALVMSTYKNLFSIVLCAFALLHNVDALHHADDPSDTFHVLHKYSNNSLYYVAEDHGWKTALLEKGDPSIDFPYASDAGVDLLKIAHVLPSLESFALGMKRMKEVPTQSPLVSVIMPSLFSVRLLLVSLRDLFANSTLTNFEVVVYCDGKHMQCLTHELLKHYVTHARNHIRNVEHYVLHFEHKVRYVCGPVASSGVKRNALVKAARADIIAVHDSSDVFDPSRLLLQLTMLLAYDADIALLPWSFAVDMDTYPAPFLRVSGAACDEPSFSAMMFRKQVFHTHEQRHGVRPIARRHAADAHQNVHPLLFASDPYVNMPFSNLTHFANELWVGAAERNGASVILVRGIEWVWVKLEHTPMRALSEHGFVPRFDTAPIGELAFFPLAMIKFLENEYADLRLTKDELAARDAAMQAEARQRLAAAARVAAERAASEAASEYGSDRSLKHAHLLEGYAIATNGSHSVENVRFPVVAGSGGVVDGQRATAALGAAHDAIAKAHKKAKGGGSGSGSSNGDGVGDTLSVPSAHLHDHIRQAAAETMSETVASASSIADAKSAQRDAHISKHKKNKHR